MLPELNCCQKWCISPYPQPALSSTTSTLKPLLFFKCGKDSLLLILPISFFRVRKKTQGLLRLWLQGSDCAGHWLSGYISSCLPKSSISQIPWNEIRCWLHIQGRYSSTLSFYSPHSKNANEAGRLLSLPKMTSLNIQLGNLFFLFCPINYYRSPAAATGSLKRDI